MHVAPLLPPAFHADHCRRGAPRWHNVGSSVCMNKGKPSGFKADTKKDAGVKSTERERAGQAGAGPEWTERKQQKQERLAVHAGGEGPPEQNAGGPDHHGSRADEDRNP